MEEVLFHEVIKDPPTKYVFVQKKIKLDKNGQIKKDAVYYLTANLFYDGTHWAIKNKVVSFAKDWIIWHLKKVPKIEKCRIEITYHHPTDTFDLDNKVYFWIKIILDLLKTPTSAQIIKAQEYNNPIKTLSVLDDDTVRFVDGIDMKYKRGESAIELKIIGRHKQEQQSLF
jgi:hypothetical protein